MISLSKNTTVVSKITLIIPDCEGWLIFQIEIQSYIGFSFCGEMVA